MKWKLPLQCGRYCGRSDLCRYSGSVFEAGRWHAIWPVLACKANWQWQLAIEGYIDPGKGVPIICDTLTFRFKFSARARAMERRHPKTILPQNNQSINQSISAHRVKCVTDLEPPAAAVCTRSCILIYVCGLIQRIGSVQTFLVPSDRSHSPYSGLPYSGIGWSLHAYLSRP